MSITTIIIAVTVLISLAGFSNNIIQGKLIFNPWSIANRNEWYRFFTSGFIHADFMHLAINMFVLYSFGTVVEMQYQFIFDDRSSFYFIVLYFGALLISVTPTYKKHRDNMGYNALGASGAVSAVLFANIFLNPWQKVYLYGLISLPGILAGTAYLIYSHYMGKRGGDNINHDAHFWGAVFGVIFTVCLKPSLFSDFISKMMHFY